MSKKQKFTYPFIKECIQDTFDKNTIACFLSVALDMWRHDEFPDVVFADILYTAAKKYSDI